MANIQLIEEVTISEWFICAIEYNDMTGLDDEEESQLNEWLDNYPCCMFDYGDSSEFAKCEITGLMSDCVTVKIYKDRS
jgi:hypothetical protein